MIYSSSSKFLISYLDLSFSLVRLMHKYKKQVVNIPELILSFKNTGTTLKICMCVLYAKDKNSNQISGSAVML